MYDSAKNKNLEPLKVCISGSSPLQLQKITRSESGFFNGAKGVEGAVITKCERKEKKQTKKPTHKKTRETSESTNGFWAEGLWEAQNISHTPQSAVITDPAAKKITITLYDRCLYSCY